VRVAALDSAGRYENNYPLLAPLTGPEPHGPFAVHLGCSNGREFGLLGFDLDAGRGDVSHDLAALLELLDSAGVPYLVARSGPTEGRHVWVRPAAPVPAGMVKQLARGLRYQLPTLDISALSNPVTGALRPPGAAHRTGGRSEIITGDLDGFLASFTSLDQLQLLTETVAASLPAVSRDATVRFVVHDAAGHPYLPGPKRALPPRSQQAVRQVVAGDVDASAVQWTVLLGAARAHWTYADVEGLVQAAVPGLEHLRTVPAKTTGSTKRLPRSAREADELLRNDWARAIAYIEATETSAHPLDAAGDYTSRLAELVDGLEAALARADACPGRWSQAGGATDRLVFDQLCVLHLQAVTGTVEADQRRLALACGIGRETARRALERLAEDGWIRQESLGAGPKAASWTVVVPPTSDPVSTGQETDGAQVVTRPADAAPTLRAELLDRLQTHIGLQVHDVFTRQGLGHDAGVIWAQIAEGIELLDLQTRTGYPEHRIDQYVGQLHDFGLWHWNDNRGRATTNSSDRDAAAEMLGVRGGLAERQRRYRLERELWAWWIEHVEWLKTPGKTKRKIMSERWRRRHSPAQLAIAMPGLTRTQRYGPYPRRAGRADHDAAKATIAAAERASATIVGADNGSTSAAA
jgi:hypothetical protein